MALGQREFNFSCLSIDLLYDRDLSERVNLFKLWCLACSFQNIDLLELILNVIDDAKGKNSAYWLTEPDTVYDKLR